MMSHRHRPWILASLLLAPVVAYGEAQRPSAGAEASRKANMDVRRILDAYRAGQINRSRAEQELHPLLKAQMKPFFANLPQHITNSREYLADLEAAQHDPDGFIRKQVKQLLEAPRPQRRKTE
jgi:hypothetical protein